MKAHDEIKKVVREKYGEIVENSRQKKESSCCGGGSVSCCDDADFSEDYSELKGYNPDADLGLGCGLPTEYAHINQGDTVLDLGSGAGNDCFVARQLAGEQGLVIGVDMTPKMIDKARENVEKLGFSNVEFRLGEIEHLPVANEVVDVVVSNCVLNLVPEKEAAFDEIYRVLKPGGHFSISDVVTYSEMPEGLRNDALLYAGCISGALIKSDYLGIIEKAGFINIKVQKEKKTELPDEMLNKHLSSAEVIQFKKDFAGIASITVYAEKS